LKQLVRNIIQPERDLGHSDSKPLKSRAEKAEEGDHKNIGAAEEVVSPTFEDTKQSVEVCEECK
jgi:hypothetical protein